MLTIRSIYCGVNLAYTTEISTPLSASFRVIQICNDEPHREADILPLWRASGYNSPHNTMGHSDKIRTASDEFGPYSARGSSLHTICLHDGALAQTTLNLRRAGSVQSPGAQITHARESCLKCIVIDPCSPLVCRPSRRYTIISLSYVLELDIPYYPEACYLSPGW
jgi:hypothetical protein